MSRVIYRNRSVLALLLAVALVASLAPNAVASAASENANWGTDAAHTEINFSIKHFFTPVTGSFEDYEIDLDYNAENPEQSTVEARIKVASVNTGNEKRDNHLRTADWFEAEAYPYMTFKSTSVRQAGDNQLIASGPLTIKGQSREVELPITLLGKQMIPEQMQQMLGGTKEVASFKASTAIDRGDFGVGTGNWAATMVVGGEVDIEILLEAHNK
ncbi:MAG: polyisoprenoid-binding protein [bacterium]|nr:polyisoprenoid-binding protein [bacterium]